MEVFPPAGDLVDLAVSAFSSSDFCVALLMPMNRTTRLNGRQALNERRHIAQGRVYDAIGELTVIYRLQKAPTDAALAHILACFFAMLKQLSPEERSLLISLAHAGAAKMIKEVYKRQSK